MHDVRKNVSQQSQVQLATSKQLGSCTFDECSSHEVWNATFAQHLTFHCVDTRLASERIAVRSQNLWLCIYTFPPAFPR